MGFHERLRQALDHQAILEQMARYIQAVDRCDLALLKSTFHADGAVRFGIFNGNAHDFCEFDIPFIQEHLVMGWHRFTNASIEFQTPHRAVAESYMLGNAAARLPSGELVNCPDNMRYLDIWEQREGTWRMASRDLVLDWNASCRYTGRDEGVFGQCPQGRRDRDDLAYHFQLLP